MMLSIVIPVLNEARLIQGFLRQLREPGGEFEIIVVDGGSEDDTVSRCRGLADRVLVTPRGRAGQMNAGARAARGEVLWFLHADTTALPPGALHEIARALRADRLVGGCFRLRLPGRQWVYRVSDSLGNLGVEFFGFALGDHGIFCRRDTFMRVGGYPDVPLMEDAELYRRLRRRGRMRQLPGFITSSPRRYEQLGPYRTTAFYVLILALYVLGVRPRSLAVVYRWLVRSGHGAQPVATPGRARSWQTAPTR